MYARKFTLRHTFENISNLADQDGPIEVHFGIPWRINVEKKDGGLSLYLGTPRLEDKKNPWTVAVIVEFRAGAGEDKLVGSMDASYDKDEYHGLSDCGKWEEVMEKYVEKDKLTVEIEVTIQGMEGIVPKRKMNFDEPEEDISDVVLAVGDRKFNVSKVILGKFCDFFKPLFFSGYKEANQKEIKLEGIDPDTFQMLLEIIHGKLECIREGTVEDILHLARQYQVEVATDRCEEFMIHDGNVNWDMKFRLASEYKLVKLQERLIKKFKTLADADFALKRNIQHLDDAFVAKIMRKVYSKQ